MNNENEVSPQYQKAVRQSKELRKIAEMENDPKKYAEYLSIKRKESIDNRPEIVETIRERKSGEIIEFHHFKGRYLIDTTAHAFANKKTKTSLR